MKSTIKVAAMASIMAAILGACTATPPSSICANSAAFNLSTFRG